MPAQQAHQILASAAERTVRAMNEHRNELVARTTGILHLTQFTSAQLALHQVGGHPAKSHAHRERSFFSRKVRKIEHALAAEHMPIVALIARVLYRQLHVFMQLIESDGGFTRQR